MRRIKIHQKATIFHGPGAQLDKSGARRQKGRVFPDMDTATPQPSAV
jgi:hypothetical protein